MNNGLAAARFLCPTGFLCPQVFSPPHLGRF